MAIGAETAYRINLPVFEGPFDLLLYLIKKEEIDIWDIPIAHITEEYLRYLDLMTELNLNIAGEFLLMASMLTAIKSRLLLTSHMGDAADGIEDPRTPLVERLLEYQRYKDAAATLARRPLLHRESFPRGMPALNLPDELPRRRPDVSLLDLMSALQELLSRCAVRDLAHQVTGERFSVVQRIHWLFDRIRVKRSVGFRELFASLSSRMDMVLTFLALLEMLKANIVLLRPQSDGGGESSSLVGREGHQDWVIEERDTGFDLERWFERIRITEDDDLET